MAEEQTQGTKQDGVCTNKTSGCIAFSFMGAAMACCGDPAGIVVIQSSD